MNGSLANVVWNGYIKARIKEDRQDTIGVSYTDIGLKLDGTTNDATALSAWITSIGSEQHDLYLGSQGICKLASNITIPSNVRLISSGTVLKRTNNAVITLNCEIVAGLYQIFDDDNTGSWAGGAKLEYVYPNWFGCPCDGTNSDSAGLQKAFNFTGLNNVTLKIPNLPMLIDSAITLYSTSTHTYNVEGEHRKSSGKVITVTSDYAFVGENYASGTFTEVTLNMESVTIRCDFESSITVFKAIILYASLIEKNKFYFPNVLIEGALRAYTRFKGNRVQGFRRSIMISSSPLDGYTLDGVRDGYIAGGYNNSYLAGKLATDGGAYTVQSNDGYIDDSNYFAGSTSQTTLATVFEIDAIDNDVFINNNWFEFCEYLSKPYLKWNTVAASTYIYGCNFRENTFQYFYRLFEETTNYTAWIFDKNNFMTFKQSSMISTFTNATGAKFNTKKCGVIILDRVDNDTGVYSEIILEGNRISTLDYYIYVDTGTSLKRNIIREYNTHLLQGATGVTNLVKFRIYTSGTFTGSFTDSYIGLLQDKNYGALPTISDAADRYVDVFNGQRFYVNGAPYMTCLVGTTPTFVALT